MKKIIRPIFAVFIALFVAFAPRVFEFIDSDTFIVWLQLLGILLSISIFISWLILKRKIKGLEHEKVSNELEALKSQVSPHFLFNTLNNVYGLTLDGDKSAADVILKLSDLLRYTIYEGSKDRVRIVDEINYMQNYVDIHRIRHKDELTISFTADIQNPDQKIAPILFINLLENAFKHGAGSLVKHPYVDISLIQKGRIIKFCIINNYNPDHIEKVGGKGIANLRRRLELFYENQFTFDVVNDANGRFQSTIILQK